MVEPYIYRAVAPAFRPECGGPGILPKMRAIVEYYLIASTWGGDGQGYAISISWSAMAEAKTDPLLLTASFVFDFECIHPFTDGNGRIGRLLTLRLLYQSGYEVGRYISLERIVEESRETYYEALLQSSRGGHDLRPWWEYFLGMLTAAYKEKIAAQKIAVQKMHLEPATR